MRSPRSTGRTRNTRSAGFFRRALAPWLVLRGAPGRLAILLLSAAACGGAPSETDARVDRQQQPVVYGEDDRTELYQVTDPRLRAIATGSVVALVPRSILAVHGTTLELDAPTLGEAANLCGGERFAAQPAAALCSGLVVDSQTVLTAGHCLRGMGCPNLSVVRRYFYESENVLHAMSADDVYGCQSILAEELSLSSDTERLDYAFLKLDRPIANGEQPTPVTLRREPLRAGEPLTILGFGGGVPLKVDQAGRMADAREPTFDYFTFASDLFEGNSGSPVLDSDYRLVGIDARGGTDYTRTDAGCNVVSRWPNTSAEEQATYAIRAFEGLCREIPGATLCCTGGDGDCDRPGVRAAVNGGCGIAGRPTPSSPFFLGLGAAAVWIVRRGRIRERGARR